MKTPTQETIDIKDAEPGFYWAKLKKYEWHNLILEVYGVRPFLKLRAWQRTQDHVSAVDPEDVHDLIPIPKPGP